MAGFYNQDAYHMGLAIALAKKGEYTTRPNPTVGCVLVKDGVIIGQGFHPKAGQPHAEVFALQDAKNRGFDVQGATAYVTLEPCSHTGRTPPCADALVAAKVARVVVACQDSNPQVAGRGVSRLIQAGIQVTTGVCEQEARQLNLGFLKAMQTGMPYVRLKIAASLDGRTAMATGESKWITGDEARQDVQRLRAKSAAIITGSQTIINDNPALNVRSEMLGVSLEQVPQPKIVVVDRRGRLSVDEDYQVFANPSTLLWREDLPTLLGELVAKYQCYDVMVEAGAKLSSVFIAEGLVDELIVYQAPCILGSDALPMFDLSLKTLADQRRFYLNDVQKVGNDLRLTYLR